MKLTNRIYSLLVLLLVGSTSLWAQDDDPFDNVNVHKYQGNMTITAQVQQNGNVITDAIVAVYCKDELRGKKRVGAGTNPSLAYLTVYGEYTGYDDYLFFKVYTNGKTFTCNPNPAITFTYNGSIGTDLEPYVITLPVSLANNADNSDVLTTYNNQTCDVVLTDRTLWKDGAWNTLCLPFPLTISGSVLDGDNVDVRTLSSTKFSNGELTLNFTEKNVVTAIEAGKPYIIKWSKTNENDPNLTNLENPVFTDVTIDNTAKNVSTDYVDFVGTYSPVVYNDENRSVLFLGGSSTLYYPNGTAPTNINACRAYFQLKNGLTVGDPANPNTVRSFNLNFGEGEDTQGIVDAEANSSLFTLHSSFSEWYDMQGRKVIRPTKGLYIYKGKKVVVK